jgi:hypothetical protein
MAENLATKEWQPKFVAIVCNWCTYAGADLRYQQNSVSDKCPDHPRALHGTNQSLLYRESTAGRRRRRSGVGLTPR